MILNLTPLVVLVLMAWSARVLARRAWSQMPLEKTPSAHDRSQARNRAGAAAWSDSRARIGTVRFAKRRTISRTEES